MAQTIQKENVREHFDAIAQNYDKWRVKNIFYYRNIKSFAKSHIRPQSKVLEVGCGMGDILAATDPKVGVGIDISPEMIKVVSQRHPQHSFICSPIEDFKSEEKFDYIILVDVVDHVADLMDVFKSIYRLCHPTTKIILTTINPWWDPILVFMEKLGAKMPEGPHNFIEKRNISRIVELLDFSVSYSGYLLLFPKYIPILSFLANTLGVRIWGLNKLSAVQYMVLQPMPQNKTNLQLGCSVIIPCYNEEGNIQQAIRRIPQMGKKTETIVVNDGGTDRTAEYVQALMDSGEYPNLKLIDYSPNRGKGYALQRGFEAATEEVLMILDADLSVAPEELPRFFEPLNKGICQFVNGNRLIYPMESQAMRTINLLGNKVFGLIMTFITNQTITDTLCGTKAFYKKDYKYFKMGVDKWGDFDLLFGAAQLGNKIMEIPVHYKNRFSGKSKMKSFQHGCHLLWACYEGFKDIVFVDKEKRRKEE